MSEQENKTSQSMSETVSNQIGLSEKDLIDLSNQELEVIGITRGHQDEYLGGGFGNPYSFHSYHLKLHRHGPGDGHNYGSGHGLNKGKGMSVGKGKKSILPGFGMDL